MGMKFAIIFLSALVVISHQQFQRRQGNLIWWSPYGHYAPQPIFDNYQPVEFNDVEDSPSFRYFRPIRPAITYPQFIIDPTPDENQDNMEEKEYSDTQSRSKSSFPKNQKGRFFFPSPSMTNLLFKTATFTLTSTVSLTTLVSCVPSTQFAAGSANVICRRKRNIELLAFDDSIEPSETQKVISTPLPVIRESHQIPEEESSHHGIVSSIEEQSQFEAPALPQYVRDKRFYVNYFITSTTVTSYSFVSATVTKTVNLLPSPTVAPNLLQCRPSNFVVC